MQRTPSKRAPILLLALTGACATASRPLAQSRAFPESWYGSWAGAVQGHGPGGPRERFTMRYELGPGEQPGRSRWTIVYVDGPQRQARPYELVEIDRAKGRYAIDEGGGLLLDACLVGDVLYTSFDIGSARLLVRDERSIDAHGEETLTVEFVTSSSTPERTTPTDPAAQSFPVRHVQRATLRRAEPGAGAATGG